MGEERRRIGGEERGGEERRGEKEEKGGLITVMVL